MTKKDLNQNGKYAQELINTIEPDFVFSNKPIKRFKVMDVKNDIGKQEKTEKHLIFIL